MRHPSLRRHGWIAAELKWSRFMRHTSLRRHGSIAAELKWSRFMRHASLRRHGWIAADKWFTYHVKSCINIPSFCLRQKAQHGSRCKYDVPGFVHKNVRLKEIIRDVSLFKTELKLSRFMRSELLSTTIALFCQLSDCRQCVHLFVFVDVFN